MDLGGIRRLYLPLRPKARVSPGRKTPPGVSAPSTGLRPLIVSRVKCGGGPCRGHAVLPCTGNMICLPCAFLKNCGRFDTGLPETRSGATGPSPFKVRDNQRPERTMSGAAKTSAGVFPLHAQPPTGTKESASPLTTPDMVRSGRVLQTSVKFPIPHNFSSESDKTAPAFHSPPRSATEAALSGLRSGL